ncbi:MAG: 16S rRNA (uracil(1498)-N(3))-methyltransferase [Bdellovibrionales bacterium]|nr:16S rRNA (uracil(1498)-N(3))-methyltransferase [Oligoflexia bacterium]
MRRALCELIPSKIGSLVPLDEAEVKHLVSVLRMGPGDELELLDGSGQLARGALVFREKKVFAETLTVPTSNPKLLSLPIHLTMSVIKGEAMEWVVEKAVEMGCRTLTPVETEFTVVKMQKRGSDSFQERWQRIADQALKQSGRLDRMMVKSPIDFETALLSPQSLLWLDEEMGESGSPTEHLAAQLPTLKTVREFSIFVGPEGGFSASERQRLLQLTMSEKHEITRVHLGSIILRAETAALMGLALLVGNNYGKGKN